MIGDLLRSLSFAALFFWGMSWLCNLVSLLAGPHKRHEILLFGQLLWAGAGIAGIQFYLFKMSTIFQLCFFAFGHLVLLLILQTFAFCILFSLYKQNKQKNEKFLYQAISVIISTVSLGILWIIFLYICGVSRAA